MRRWTRYIPMAIFSALLLALIIVLWKQFVNILTLLLIASIIAYLVTPLTNLFMRKFRNGIATIFSFGVVIVILAGLLALAIPALYHQVTELLSRMPQYSEQISGVWDGFIDTLHRFGLSDSIIEMLENQAFTAGNDIGSSIREGLMKMGSGIVQNSWLALAPIASYYLVRDRVTVFDRLQHAIPAKIRPAALRWANDIREILGDYVRGQLLIAMLVGAATALGLMIAGVEGYLILGILMAVLNLIPFFGPILGLVPIVSLAAVQGRVIPALLVSVGVQQLESAFISPRIMSDATGVHPVIVIIVLMAGGSVAGAGGMLIALPVYLVLRVTAKSVYHSLISPEEAPPPVA